MSATPPPDPKPGYKNKLRRLIEKFDGINLYESAHDYQPQEHEQLVEIGKLPDDVLRIYVAYQSGLDSYVGHVRVIQKEQQVWVEKSPDITSRTLRAYLVKNIGWTQTVENEYAELKTLRSILLDECEELFPELVFEDDDKVVVRGRTLFLVLTSQDEEVLDYVRYYPETLKHLGLEKEFPELVE